MSVVNQAREAAGKPTGGEFAATAKQGAEVALASSSMNDEEYNSHGTLKYPPRPRTAEQHVSFWDNVPIPDEVLDHAVAEHEEIRQELAPKIIGERADEWDRANPRPDDTARYRGPRIKREDMPQAIHEWSEAGKANWDLEEAKFNQEWPAIPRYEARTVLRAHHIVEDANLLPEEERQKALNHEMPWGDGTATAKQIYEKFRTWHARAAMRGQG